jgi:hypothetical protein
MQPIDNHNSDNNTKKDNDEYFRLYELLSNTLRHYHERWVDNYKVFLSFNAFLLPAASALLAYVLKDNQNELCPIVVLLCIVGIIASWQGYGLLKRIRLDADLRITQLIRLESKMSYLPLKPFTEGKEYFFDKEHANDGRFPNNPYKNKGIRAIDAYRKISIAIISAYTIITLFASWPLIQLILNIKC